MNYCTLCGHDSSDLLRVIYSGNFDKSYLYDSIRVRSCKNCGHVFNDLSRVEVDMLNEYYMTEYSEFHNLSFFNQEVDTDSNILIISQNNLNHYLNAVIDFKISKKYDVIVLDQFIEHVFNLNYVFYNIKNCLYKDGILRISCPNAVSFLNNNVHFPDYNFLIREHIQHFDSIHLIYLAYLHGFYLEDIEFGNKIILNNIDMPNMIFSFKIKEDVMNIDKNFFDLKKQILKNINPPINITTKPYYCYGIGKEFLFLKRNNFIKPIGLIDSTSSKKNYTVDGMNIYDDNIIKALPEDSTILITAIAHIRHITEKLHNLGYRGTISYVGINYERTSIDSFL